MWSPSATLSQQMQNANKTIKRKKPKVPCRSEQHTKITSLQLTLMTLHNKIIIHVCDIRAYAYTRPKEVYLFW